MTQEYCGNGSLMRASPIPLVYSHSLSTAYTHAMLSSDLTHPNPVNTEACLAYTMLITRALHGWSKADLARELGNWEFRTMNLKKRFEGMKAVGDWEMKDEDSIKSTGWVVDTLEASCWAFFSTNDFREGALKVVNLGEPLPLNIFTEGLLVLCIGPGDDADTVGAIYGALAGAYYGFNAIPKEWVEGLVKREVVGQIADGLIELAEKEVSG
jgi:ADP-ribosyl-[dinitrogen reductase] hydrolase